MSDQLPTRSQDTPASQGMLLEFRAEIHHQFSSLRNQTEARFDKMEARFDKIDSRFNTLESKIDAIHSLVHAANLRAEEQRAENRVVMDGLTGLFQRQERVEARVDAVEKNIGLLGI